MASVRINILKIMCNEIEHGKRVVEAAWQLAETDYAIKNKATTYQEYGEFVRAWINMALDRAGCKDKVDFVAPSAEGKCDGYYGYLIEGVHQSIYQEAKQKQYNKYPDGWWQDVLKNETDN